MTAHMQGPTTPEQRALGAVFATVLMNPDRPLLHEGDDPMDVDPDAAYELGVHLARLAAAHGYVKPPPTS